MIGNNQTAKMNSDSSLFTCLLLQLYACLLEDTWVQEIQAVYQAVA